MPANAGKSTLVWIAAGTGIVFLYAAWQNKNPLDLLKNALTGTGGIYESHPGASVRPIDINAGQGTVMATEGATGTMTPTASGFSPDSGTIPALPSVPPLSAGVAGLLPNYTYDSHGYLVPVPTPYTPNTYIPPQDNGIPSWLRPTWIP